MSWPMVLKPLISTEQIQTRVRELSRQIALDYKGESFVMVTVLEGARRLAKSLTDCLDHPTFSQDSIKVSSYQGTKSTGTIKVIQDLSQPLNGRRVLLVEDIVETGHTIGFLIPYLQAKGAKELRLCSLLYKPIKAELRSQIDYLGFEIPDKFVVGFGLDYEGQYRELDSIFTL